MTTRCPEVNPQGEQCNLVAGHDGGHQAAVWNPPAPVASGPAPKKPSRLGWWIRTAVIVVVALVIVGAISRAGKPAPGGTPAGNAAQGADGGGARSVSLNQTVTVDGVDVTIKEAHWAAAIDEYQKPPAGYVYVAYKVALKSNRDAEFVGANDWTALADGTKQGTWTIAIGDKYEPALAFEELRPGASLEGWIVFEVPRPAGSVTLVYDPSFFADDARVTFEMTCCK